MADNQIGNALSGLGGLGGAVNGTTSQTKKNDQVGKDEFLQLLVTQLKNQDPLDPMKGEEFAVNLAQFSQLEQLISINGKLGGEDQTDLSSLASYLGKEVTLAGDQVQFKSGDGGIVKFNLPTDASQVKIELLNTDGSVKDVIDVGALSAGKQSIALSGAASENGSYGFRITAIPTAGGTLSISGAVAGIVSGFVPGPQPTLLVSGREIDPSEVVEVSLPAVAS